MSRERDKKINQVGYTKGFHAGAKAADLEHAKHIAKLEARMILTMRLDYANYPGYVTTALHEGSIPKEVLECTDAICKSEDYNPTLKNPEND